MGGAELIDRAADSFFEGDCLPADDAPPDSDAERCRKVWVAVILQAFRDAQGIGELDAGAGDKAEARRFLLSDLGPWRKDRETIADLAGMDDLDGDALRDRAERCLRPMIEKERQELKRVAAALKHKARMAAYWIRRKAGQLKASPERCAFIAAQKAARLAAIAAGPQAVAAYEAERLERKRRNQNQRQLRYGERKRLRAARAGALGHGAGVGRGDGAAGKDASLARSPALPASIAA